MTKCLDCPEFKVTVYANLKSIATCEKRNFVTDGDKSCDWWDGYFRARELYFEEEREKVGE